MKAGVLRGLAAALSVAWLVVFAGSIALAIVGWR